MSLTIGFDWPRDGLTDGHGQFRYGVELFLALERLNTSDRYVVFGTRPKPPPLIAHLFTRETRWEWVPKPVATGRSADLVNQWRNFRCFRKRSLDLVHVIDGTIPIFPPCPVIATTHDVMVEVFRDEYAVWRASRGYRRFKWLNRWLVTHHLASSRTTADDLAKWWHIPRRRITVVYLGNDAFPPAGLEHSWQTTLASQFPQLVQSRFVVSQYHLEPRKNLHVLVKAFGMIRNQLPDVKLVLFGTRGTSPDREDRFRQLVSEHGLNETVIHVGVVADDQLAALYRGAEVCAFPSLYEGFGYPQLEAMAAGGCVLARGASAMAEVVGSAGLLVETADAGTLANGLIRLLRESSERKILKTLGPTRAAEFNTDRMARETRAVYTSVLGRV